MNKPKRREITFSDDTFKVSVPYRYEFPCNVTVEIDNGIDQEVYDSTKCKFPK